MPRIRPALLAGVLAAFACSAALAAGGGAGGGGDLPSASGPTYDPQLEYAKGVAALNSQDYRAAERAFARVVAAQPKSAEAWRLLGAANAAQADHKGARRAFNKAVKLDPDNVAAHQGLGVALGGLKDAKAQAELDWLKARAKSCGACAEAAALQAATTAVERAMAGSPAAALVAPSLFAGIERTPRAGDRAYLEAVSLINARRYDEALTSLERAREAFGPHPDVLTYQGYAWRKKGDPVRAEAYYRQALAIAPAHRGATEYYGELKVARGDLRGAKLMLARLDRACAFGCAEAEELRRWIDAGGEPAR